MKLAILPALLMAATQIPTPIVEDNVLTFDVRFSSLRNRQTAQKLSTNNAIGDSINNSYITNYYNAYAKDTYQTPMNNYIDVNTSAYSMCVVTDALDDLQIYTAYTISIQQVTPYINLENTNIDMKYSLNLNGFENMISGEDSTYYNYQSYQTDTSLNNYMSLQNWSNLEYNNIEDLIQEIRYNASYGEGLKDLAQNTTPQFIDGEYTDIEFDIPDVIIQDRRTTYIVTIVKTIIDDTKHRAQEGMTGYKGTSLNRFTITGDVVETTATYEVVDIAGLMFTILGMPFAFISQAFNLTLFDGTPYQINISQTLLAIIGIALLLWLLKVILGKADIGQFINDARSNTDANLRETRRHKTAQELETTKHNNRLEEQRQKESNRHARAQRKNKK